MFSSIAQDSNKETARQKTNDLDTIAFLMSEALPNMDDGGIRGPVVNVLKLCE